MYRTNHMILVTVIALFGASTLLPGGLQAQSSTRNQISSQEQSLDEVFFPFISSLRVAVKDGRIRISWRDVPNYQNDYLVYRHTEEIHEGSLADAVLAAEVPPGTEQYTDAPPESGEYYYAVLTQERNGSPLAVFIPFRNQTVRPIAIETDAQPEQLRITAIQADREDNEVHLQFDSNLDDRDLAVMRSPTPITNHEDIPEATLLEVISGTRRSYRDTPPAGVTYYYGIFEAATVGSDNAVVRPGDNATTSGIALELPEEPEDTTSPEPPQVVTPPEVVPPEVPAEPERTASGDTIPLPLLQSRFSVLLESRMGGFPMHIPESRQLSEKTGAAVAALLSHGSQADDNTRMPPPRQLSQDKAPEHSSSQLADIINEDFVQENWNQSYTRLTGLLDNSLSAELERHVRFYRGQVLLFLKRPRQALNEMLMVRDSFYLETEPFIDAALQGIAADS